MDCFHRLLTHHSPGIPFFCKWHNVMAQPVKFRGGLCEFCNAWLAAQCFLKPLKIKKKIFLLNGWIGAQKKPRNSDKLLSSAPLICSIPIHPRQIPSHLKGAVTSACWTSAVPTLFWCHSSQEEEPRSHGAPRQSSYKCFLGKKLNKYQKQKCKKPQNFFVRGSGRIFILLYMVFMYSLSTSAWEMSRALPISPWMICSGGGITGRMRSGGAVQENAASSCPNVRNSPMECKEFLLARQREQGKVLAHPWCPIHAEMNFKSPHSKLLFTMF